MKHVGLLYDQILTNPHVDQELKDDLKGCMVIDATNVSDYYYQGTDQEIWDLGEDFPNVAPPFESFFLEFHAPSHVVSSVNGTRPWYPDKQPSQWGLLCQSMKADGESYDFETPKGKTEALKRTLEQLHSLEESMDMEKLESIASAEQMKSYVDSLSDSRKRVLSFYAAGARTRDLMVSGKWDEVRTLLTQAYSGARWVLGFTLFQKFNAPNMQSNIGPFWGFDQLLVSPEGRTIKREDGKTVHTMHHAYGAIERTLRNALASDYEKGVELHETLRDGFMPMLHTALLAISFMHCKNVSLKEIIPPDIEQTPKQKQRGVQPRQLVTYHVLDIEPMKQILRTEGNAEHVGLQRSLHICRGHFAHYDEDHKLFGKYAGTFWKPQHIRGSAKIGVATKDYRMKQVKV